MVPDRPELRNWVPTHPTATEPKLRGPEQVPLPFTCEMGTATLPPSLGGCRKDARPGVRGGGRGGEALSGGC